MTTITNGFRKISIRPLEPNVFTDNFLPAETTNILTDFQNMRATLVDFGCGSDAA
jgi:hypothetical protein